MSYSFYSTPEPIPSVPPTSEIPLATSGPLVRARRAGPAPVHVGSLSAADHAEWDAFVESHPLSTCYHYRGWQTIARNAYRLETPFLVAREGAGGPLVGILPLFVIPGPFQGHLANGLFGGYGPVLAKTEIARRALVETAVARFDDTGLKYFMLKCGVDESASTPEGFTEVEQWGIATLPLQRDWQRIWDGFDKKIRNCVRKATKFGLEPRWGHGELGVFYDILAENMHHKGTPIYGLRLLGEMLHAFGDRANVITLWHQGRAVAGAFLIEHRRTVCVPFASSRPDSLHMSPNNLLYWEIIRRSAEKGLETLDFGQSLRDSGGLSFKLGWGAVEHPMRCFVRSAKGAPPKIKRGDPAVELLVKVWKRLPRPVADWLGPKICRRFLA